jgi:hypothetical protein
VYGNELNVLLYRAFGEKAVEISPVEREKFFNDLRSIEKNEVLLTRLMEYWHLSKEKAEEVATFVLPDKYCAYSFKALQEILPELEAGVGLSEWLKLNNHALQSEKEFDFLPLVDDCGFELRNPIVHRVLAELRRVVNSIIARYGKPDRIHVELARDLKATNAEREKMTRRIQQREKTDILLLFIQLDGNLDARQTLITQLNGAADQNIHRQGGQLGINDVNLLIGNTLCGNGSALHGARQLGGNGDNDQLVFLGTLVKRNEIADSRLGGGGQLLRRCQLLIKLFVGDVDIVAVFLFTEDDLQGGNADAQLVGFLGGDIRCGVCDNTYAHIF